MPRDFVDSGARERRRPGGRGIWSTPGLDHNLRMSRLASDRETRVPDDVLLRPFNDTHSPLSVGQGTLADTTAHYDSPVTRPARQFLQ